MPKKRDMNAPYWQQLREAERRIIEYALEHGGSLRGTAAILGISSNFLSERARELGVPTPEVRPGPKPGTKRPNLRVVPPSEAATDEGNTPPKPPRRPPASTEAPEALSEGDEDEDDEDEDDEEWYEDPDEGDDDSDEYDGDDEEDDEDADDDEDENAEGANQSSN